MIESEDAFEGPYLVAAGTPGNIRFGELLKGLRERSGLNPQELAERADVHVSFVRGIERGAQAPSVATAGPLLAVMTEQDGIRWVDDGPFDLLVRDPQSGQDVAFEFKARVKGQNKRLDAEPSPWSSVQIAELAGSLAVAVASSRGTSDISLAKTLIQGMALAMPRKGFPPLKVDQVLAEAEAAAAKTEAVASVSVPSDDSALGRIVRLLAAADQATLDQVERVLREGSGLDGAAEGPGPS